MHEVRVTCGPETADRVVALALGHGLEHVAVSHVDLPARGRSGRQVSLELSTPKAREFLEALQAESWFDLASASVTTRQLRALMSADSQYEVTRPMSEPMVDIFQDLWQLSHVTPSYWGRAVTASILLAAGMFEGNPVEVVIAALFLPFLSQILACSFGLWNKDRALARHGLRALLISTLIALAAGALLACIEPVQAAYPFKSFAASMCLATITGATAGLCSADDAGRRYLISVAAAVQCGVYPVWFGACMVLGFPSGTDAVQKLGSFFGTIVVLGAAAALAYATLKANRTAKSEGTIEP